MNSIQYTIFSVFLFLCLSIYAQKTYYKSYFDNGNIKSEGWIENNRKTDYWKFYYQNGNIKQEGRFLTNTETKYWYFYRENGTIEKEGHYINGFENKWWIFYNKKGDIDYKCQLINNQKSGYCFKYQNEKIIKAEKYKSGTKIKEWTDLNSFRKENKLSDFK